jgi:6-pyruvoyltetrahydropterin/6-carboxytetrahydropterin synthase
MLTIKPRPVQFSAAHHLPGMPDGHRCRRMHGHTYKVSIEVTGELVNGMLPDYERITEIVKSAADLLDHRTLNEIAGLENPTTEQLACWIAERVEFRVRLLSAGAVLLAVEVDEGGHVCRWTP